MNRYICCLVAALLGTVMAWGQEPIDRSTKIASDDGIEVLTRGPVHEAFAGTITFDPEPGMTVPKPVPEPIEELPPEQKPPGENLAWIPGYWAWDDDREDYLWVSGIWRSLPPGRQWISGYWSTSEQESQWTSGYWADAQASEVEYLPEPPQTVEAGPNLEQPSLNHTWLPGCWIWQQNRYAWRPGFWATAQQNWVWNPSHYVWTPRGYVFVDGYYDYPVAQRGVLFAPVFFNNRLRSQRGFLFSPRTVIRPAVFAAHLFLRPSYGHYYFGDYYGNNYVTRGFSPWFSFSSTRAGYDPFFAHQHWTHLDDQQWNQRIERDFAYRRDHDDARPPHTWSDQRARHLRDGTKLDESFSVAGSFDELAKSENASERLKMVAQQERDQLGQHALKVREAREERRKLEVQAANTPGATTFRDLKDPIRQRLPKTTVVSPPIDRFSAGQGPPKALDLPQPDNKIQPQSRRQRGNVNSTKANSGTQKKGDKS